ncbi:MAG: AEC family transporter [Chloroflexota bacterium]
MLDVFLNVIMPVFLVAVIAGVFQRWRKVPVGPLSQVTLYLLIPALIFTSLVEQKIPASASARIVGTLLLTTTLIILTSIVVSKILRHDRAMRSAFMLSTGFPNAGNLALPILLLAFGEEGLAVGVIVFVTQAINGQSLGVFVAAGSQMNGMESLKQVFKLPAVYAIVAALLVRALGIELPLIVSQPVKLLSQATIPSMLMVLGFQLGGELRLNSLGSLAAALVVRLLISVPLAYFATVLFGLDALSQSVVIIVYAMPVAVYTIILSTEFKTNPQFVTNAVVTSTLVSTLSLTLIIPMVKSFVGG